MNQLTKALKDLYDEENATFLVRFFKTGKGEYGEGDKFLGIKVPEQRTLVKRYYKELSFNDIETMMHDEYHEIRLSALIALTLNMKDSDLKKQEAIVKLYLENTKYINNWDLVDISAPNILGKYLYENKLDRSILYGLAHSNDLWKQRIAIISTQYFIKQDDFEDTLEIAQILLNHKHDLIHKAVGWMLREVGNHNYDILYDFLMKNYKVMPRTMLRYAIEKFDSKTREMFLKK